MDGHADSANHYLRNVARRGRDNPAVLDVVDLYPSIASAEPEDLDMDILEELQFAQQIVVRGTLEAYTIRGGVNALSGRRSRVDVNAIVASATAANVMFSDCEVPAPRSPTIQVLVDSSNMPAASSLCQVRSFGSKFRATSVIDASSVPTLLTVST